MARQKASVYMDDIAFSLRTYRKHGASVWRDVAEELSRKRSRRREVNVSHISKVTAKGSLVVVPGKVLGTGVIGHAVVVGAAAFSKEAARKISDAGGKVLSLKEFIQKNQEGKGVQIVG